MIFLSLVSSYECRGSRVQVLGILKEEVNGLLSSISYGSGSVNIPLSSIFLHYSHKTLPGRQEFPPSDKGTNWRSERLENLSKTRNYTLI